MGRFLFPLLLIALGAYGLAEHDQLTNQWNAMYPEGAAEQDALARCAQEDGMFNRFSATGRAACYQKYLQVQLPAPTPGITVGIPGQPPGQPPTHVVPHAPPVRNNSNLR